MPESTLDHSIPYPSPSDPVRGSTADYLQTDLRDLARGADSAISAAVGTRAPLSHTHSQADVTGLPGALASAGETAQWGSVSGKPSAYPPSAHSHAVDDVTGLADRLASLEYDSGIRDLTAHLNSSDWVADRVLLTRTPGRHVTLTVSNLRRVGEQSSAVFYTLPSGFRPTATPSLPRSFYGLLGSGNPPRTAQMDIDRNGHLRLFVNMGDAPVQGTLTWGTPDPIPTTLPGDPA